MVEKVTGGSVWPIRCGWCNALVFKPVRDVNRAEARRANLYCHRECAGMARRDLNPPTATEKRAGKSEYDRQRRAELGERLRAEKRAAYHAKVAADPVGTRAVEREQRQRRMPQHVEYCRRPEYRKWKAQYDQKYRAEQQFGPFSEASIILNQLEAEILGRATRTEIYRAKGTLNKTQERKRDYVRQTGNSLRR